MTPEKKKEIIDHIRQTHKIAIDEDDPIFAVITANEIVFEEHMKNQDIMFTEHLANIETNTELYLSKAKDLAEVKISKAVENAHTQLEQFKREAKEELAVTPSMESTITNKIPVAYWVMLLFAAAFGYGAALVLLPGV